MVVWKLDRLGRSLPHLIETVTSLEKRGIGFRSLTEAIDTTTSSGRLIFHIFGALGQFERDLIRERTRAGLNAAISRGRRGGRKPVITAEKLRRARALIEQGFSVREAAARIKVGKTALYVALYANAGAAPRKKVRSRIVHASRTVFALSCLHPITGSAHKAGNGRRPLPAATGIARSVRLPPRGNGWPSVRPNSCRSLIITSSSPCRPRSAPSRSPTRPPSTTSCSGPRPTL